MAMTRILCKYQSLKIGFLAALAVYILLSVINFGFNKVARIPRVIQQYGESNSDEYFAKLIASQQHLPKAQGFSAKNGRIFLNNIEELSDRKHSGIGSSVEAKKSERGNVFDENYSDANALALPPIVDLDVLPFMRDKHYEPAKCPKTVLSLTKYSRWFRDRFQPDVKIFLEPSDVGTYSDYYKLLHYRLPFGFRLLNKTKLTTILNHPNFTNAPLYSDGRPSKCMSCAVVGCGGILNGSGAGPEIDSHDYVFRLNRAHSAGRYAEDVGHKTSFYTFFPESMHIQDLEDENATFFYAMFKSYDLDYAINLLRGEKPPRYVSRGKLYPLRKPHIDKSKLKIIHPDFFRYVFTRYLDTKAVRPTTGAIVVFLALHLCDEVTIYGFGYDPRFTLHYYDKTFRSHSGKVTALHDVDNERELWHKLHDEGVIRLFKRDV